MMPALSMSDFDLPDVPDEKREAISLWIKSRLEESEAAHQNRIELLRTAGEHPSPIFSRFVRLSGELGLTKTLAAKQLGITVGMLMKFYADDYELGAAEILSAIAANMNRKAISETDPAAAKVGMAIMERRGGDEWKPPKKQVELDDSRNKAPIIDSSKLTYDERQQLRLMLTRVANGGDGDPVEPDETDTIIE
jgi:hypothetical protein